MWSRSRQSPPRERAETLTVHSRSWVLAGPVHGRRHSLALNAGLSRRANAPPRWTQAARLSLRPPSPANVASNLIGRLGVGRKWRTGFGLDLEFLLFALLISPARWWCYFTIPPRKADACHLARAAQSPF